MTYFYMYCRYSLLALLGSYCLEVNGQRVYVNAEQHSSPQTINVVLATVTLSEVQNPGQSVDGVYTNFSTLFTTLGALGLIEASQNIQFTGSVKPIKDSPLTIKFSAASSLLTLVAGISLQYTNGGALVGTAYSNSSLLNLLNLFGAGATAEVIVPAPGVAYDGIRLTVNATALAAAISANLYYGFFIVAPTTSDVTICSGQQGTLSISNFQSGYEYKLYDQLTGGTLVASTSTTSIQTPVLSSQKVYYLEAVESTKYPSARTKVTVNVSPLPSAPLVHLGN